MDESHAKRIADGIEKLEGICGLAEKAQNRFIGDITALGVRAAIESSKIQFEFAKMQAENAAAQDRYSKAIKWATWIIALATIAQVFIAIFKGPEVIQFSQQANNPKPAIIRQQPSQERQSKDFPPLLPPK